MAPTSPTSYHSIVCPLRAAAFLSEPGDCDRLAKWRLHKHTPTHRQLTCVLTHISVWGWLAQEGTQTVAGSSYKTLPGRAQSPAASCNLLPLCQDRVRTGSRGTPRMNDIYKAAVRSHFSAYALECAAGSHPNSECKPVELFHLGPRVLNLIIQTYCNFQGL